MFNKGLIERVCSEEKVWQVLLLCDRMSFRKLVKVVDGVEQDEDLVAVVPVNVRAKID